MNKKALFWVIISFLILIDAGLILYQFVYKKPKADINLTPNAANIKNFNLTPQINPNPTPINLSFQENQKIYTPESNYFYKHPVLLEREEDNLLFLARGKSSVKLDEIIYTKTFDLADWAAPTSIKNFTDKKIVDLFATKNQQGYYLLYITQDNNQKYETNYLYSINGTDWSEKTINLPTAGLKKVSATADKNSLRTIFLDANNRTIKQNFLLQNRTWTSIKTVINLNLEISDMDLIATPDFYYLLFSSSNILYETHSVDFHTFSAPQAIVNLKDNDFYLSDIGLITLNAEGVFLAKNDF